MNNARWLMVLAVLATALNYLADDPITDVVTGIGAMVFIAASIIVDSIERKP